MAEVQPVRQRPPASALVKAQTESQGVTDKEPFLLPGECREGCEQELTKRGRGGGS